MQFRPLLLAASTVAAMISGCEASVSAEKSEAEQATEEPAPQSRSALVVDGASLLEPCQATNEGQLVYVVDQSVFMTCSNTQWTIIDIKGDKGDPGKAGAKGAAGTNGTNGSGLSSDPTKLPLAGGTLTGALNVPTNGLAVGTNQLVTSPNGVSIGTTDPTFGATYGADQLQLGVTGRNDSTNSFGRLVLANKHSVPVVSEPVGALDFVSTFNAGAEKRTAFITSTTTGAGGVDGFGGDLRFATKADNGPAANHMTLSSQGSLGIGTTSPTNSLHVVNNAAPPARFERSSNSVSGTANAVLFNPDLTNGNSSRLSFDALDSAAVEFRAVDITAWVTDHAAASRASDLTFATMNNAASPTERMRISSTGKVGIGTTNPLEKLHINGGNLYLGNTPNGASDINGMGGIALQTVSGPYFKIGVGDTYAVIQSFAGVPLILNPLGNAIGIGTTTPATGVKLDINGLTKLRKYTTTPGACTVALDGTIALKSDYGICVCDGADWVYTHSGATCGW